MSVQLDGLSKLDIIKLILYSELPSNNPIPSITTTKGTNILNLKNFKVYNQD